MPGRLLTPDEQAALKAALALARTDQTAFAEKKGLGYWRVNRMLNGREPVTKSYARHFNRLLRDHLPALSGAAAA